MRYFDSCSPSARLMLNFRSRTLSLAIGLLSAISPFAMAHETGAKLEQEAGDYLVELSYDTPQILPGQKVEFHVSLIEDHQSSNWQYAAFDTAWIQIKDPKGSAFRQVVSTTTTGVLTLQHPFTKDGNYTFSVRFLEGENTIAEAQFPLNVGSSQVTEASSKTLVFFLFIIALAAVLYVVWKRRQSEAHHHKRSKR